jgi:hypothetical protein
LAIEYTDEYIEELITCPKRITEPPPKEMKKERGHWKKSFGVESEDGDHRFTVFIRYNDEFIEITDRYTSWQEALQYFLKHVNIKGAAEFFPPPQSDLFD